MLDALWVRFARRVLPDHALRLAWPHLDSNDRRWLTNFLGGDRGWAL